jgi:hypothetical protein
MLGNHLSFAMFSTYCRYVGDMCPFKARRIPKSPDRSDGSESLSVSMAYAGRNSYATQVEIGYKQAIAEAIPKVGTQ